MAFEEEKSELLSGVRTFIEELDPDPRVRELLTISVGRIFERDIKRGLRPLDETRDPDEIRHIVDWVKGAVVSEEAWLSKVDASGRPVKLMKFGSIAAMTREADKAMRRLRSDVRPDGDEDVEMQLGDGFRLVRLVTATDLDAESAVMQHCIGNGAYDANLGNPELSYYSLRNHSGPHATLEVDNARGLLLQLQGKQNRDPGRHYIEALRPFFKRRKLTIPSSGLFVPTADDYVLSTDGDLHFLDNLPDRLSVAGHLSVHKMVGIKMPVWLETSGFLDVSGSRIAEFPLHLRVGGDLIFSASETGSFPTDMHVGGRLEIHHTDRTELPDGLTVGTLSAHRSQLARLPARLTVLGDCMLSHTPVSSIPSDAVFGRNLMLHGSMVHDFPDGLRVRGDVDLSGSPIERLPDNLRVDGDLALHGSKVSALGENTVIGGSLDVRSCMGLKRLPDDIVVGGSIRASFSGLAALPPKLKDISGTLNIAGTRIASLPEGLNVARNLDISLTPILIIPEGTRVGELNMAQSHVERLPESLSTLAGLSAIRSSLRELPAGMNVNGVTDLSWTPITELPEGMTTQYLYIDNTGITALPAGLTVTKDVNIEGTEIMRADPSVRIEGRIYPKEARSKAVERWAH